MDRTRACVARLLDARSAGIGIQLCVIRGHDVVLDAAWGRTLGGALETDHLHNVYCGTKPLLPLAVGLLIDAGRLALDTPIAAILGASHRLSPRASTTLADLLCHTAGLGDPRAGTWRMHRPDRRAGLLDVVGAAPAPRYSEIVSWLVLEAVVERLTDRDAGTFLRAEVLRPLALETIVVDARDLGTAVGDLRVPYGGLPDEAIPLLSERMPSQLADLRPAFGALATMSSLARLYAALGDVYAGRPRDGLPTPGTFRAMLDRRRGRVVDEILGHAADFGGGFMRDLGGEGVSARISPSSFGHTAGLANVMAFHDPASALSVALFCNGVVLDRPTLVGIRGDVVEAVHQDLGAVAA